ncbi:hypothetical protein QA802_23005 [Streptomyces sp. B21-105]|uniref:hypothetical protein n=1 Tax=Streptomyces sp. B21-105 TaxID=3039417 RepID=UPI002FEFEA03
MTALYTVARTVLGATVARTDLRTTDTRVATRPRGAGIRRSRPDGGAQAVDRRRGVAPGVTEGARA